MSKTIFVAGHNGMVGSNILNALKTFSDSTLLTVDRKDIDFVDQNSVNQFFLNRDIDQIYIAAAHVGGIEANNRFPADFLYNNLMIEANIIHSAWRVGIKKILFLGSSCIYPKYSKQPISEADLLTGKLEPTNEPYAIAKIAGIKLCESYNRQYAEDGIDYRSIMPSNLYGPGDNYHPTNSHVLPALIRRFHESKVQGLDDVVVWGSGKVRREFLFVDDLADAAIHVMNLPKVEYDRLVEPMNSHLNVGYGSDVTISELAEIIKSIVGFRGKIIFDTTKPDGTPRKLLDSSKIISTGWKPKIALYDGIKIAYQDFIDRFCSNLHLRK